MGVGLLIFLTTFKQTTIRRADNYKSKTIEWDDCCGNDRVFQKSSISKKSNKSTEINNLTNWC